MSKEFEFEKIFIPEYIASKLKDLGFNDPCIAFHYIFNGEKKCLISTVTNTNSSWDNEFISGPTWEQTIGWFRDDKKINIEITRFPNINKWGFVTTDMTIIPKYLSSDEIIKYNNLVTSPNRYDTYEDARIDAILHAIEFYLNKYGKS